MTPIGIYVAEQPDPSTLTVGEQTSEWKYPVPDINQLDLVEELNQTELNFFERHLPRTCDLWERVASHNLTVDSIHEIDHSDSDAS